MSAVAAMAARSMLCWDMAVKTAVGEAMRTEAMRARDNARESWASAVRHEAGLGTIPLAEVIDDLEGARELAAEWGDDAEERAALAMLLGEVQS